MCASSNIHAVMVIFSRKLQERQEWDCSVNVTVEIGGEFPNGAPDHIKRAVSENANSLGLKNKSWD